MRELRVENLARILAIDVYQVTEHFPIRERYGLSREIRRSAISVGSNIAEGSGRRSDRELGRFSDIAIGSIRELMFQLAVAHDLGFVEDQDHQRMRDSAEQIRAMLLRLKRNLD